MAKRFEVKKSDKMIDNDTEVWLVMDHVGEGDARTAWDYAAHVWRSRDGVCRCVKCSGPLTAMLSSCPHALAVKRAVARGVLDTQESRQENDDGTGRGRQAAPSVGAAGLRQPGERVPALRPSPGLQVSEREAPLREVQLEPGAERLRASERLNDAAGVTVPDGKTK